MKIQTLEYFIVLAESSSINEAAQRLYMGQPSLTKALHLMEEELGTVLFIRSKSGIALTEEGKKMLPEARQVLKYYRGWCGLAERRTLKRVNICSHISLAGFLILDIVLRFQERYPELKFKCSTAPNPEGFAVLAANSPAVSLCIYEDEQYRAINQRPDFKARMLTEGYYGCLVNKSSLLAQKNVVTFDDLKDYYLALPSDILPENMERGGSWASFVKDFLPDMLCAIKPNHVVQVDAVSSVIKLTMEWPEIFAVSFFPAHYRYAGVRSGELLNVPMAAPCTRGQLCLVYSRRDYRCYPVVRDLVNGIADACSRFVAENTGVSAVRSD